MARAGIVVVVGNPKPRSRTRVAAEAVGASIAALVNGPNTTGVTGTTSTTGTTGTTTIDLADDAAALLGWGSPAVGALKATVLDATALVIASPTYKAAYTGLLKLFLDQFERDQLAGTPTVALMTGGSPHHALAVEVHLRPVLVEIGASLPTRGLYLAGPEVDAPGPVIEQWLAESSGPLRRALMGA